MVSASLRRVKPEFVVPVVVVVLLTGQLMYPHMIGIADSHDWERLMSTFGLYVPSNVPDAQHYYYYVVRYFAMGGPTTAISYPSSALPLLLVAIAINELLHPGLFDLEVLGYLYIILYALAAFLIVRNLRLLLRATLAVWVIAAAGIVIFCDLAYTAYFNSVYSEPEELVFLMLFVGATLWLFAERRPRYWPLLIASVAALGFVTAKTQTVPMVVAFIPVYSAFALRYRLIRWRVLTIACFLLICLGAGLVTVTSPKDLSTPNLYDSVFAGILQHDSAQSAATDLSELGVQPKWAYLRGVAYYAPASMAVQYTPAFESDFYGHVTRATVVRFYLAHPSRLLFELDQSSQASNDMRPWYLGNYSIDYGYPPRAQSHRFTLWSSLRAKHFPPSFALLALLYTLYFAVVLWALIRARGPVERGLPFLFATIGLLAILQFPIPVLADGESELTKHLYIYDALGDLCLLISFGWLLRKLITNLAPSWQQETASPLPALAPKKEATRAAGSAFNMTQPGWAQYGRWLFGALSGWRDVPRARLRRRPAHPPRGAAPHPARRSSPASLDMTPAGWGR